MILYVYSNRKKNFYANNKEKGELMNIAFFLTPKNQIEFLSGLCDDSNS